MDGDYANSASSETGDVPGLPDLAITQECSIASTNLPGDTTNPTADATNEDEVNDPEFLSEARKRVRTSFKNRGVRDQKLFILLDDDNIYLECLQQIEDSFLNGIIMAVPRKGHSKHEIWWDTS